MLYRKMKIDENDILVNLQNESIGEGIEGNLIEKAKRKFHYSAMVLLRNTEYVMEVLRKENYSLDTFSPLFNTIAFSFRKKKYEELGKDYFEKLTEVDRENLRKEWIQYLQKECNELLENPLFVGDLMAIYHSEGIEKEYETTKKLNIKFRFEYILKDLIEKYNIKKDEDPLFDEVIDNFVESQEANTM